MFGVIFRRYRSECFIANNKITELKTIKILLVLIKKMVRFLISALFWVEALFRGRCLFWSVCKAARRLLVGNAFVCGPALIRENKYNKNHIYHLCSNSQFSTNLMSSFWIGAQYSWNTRKSCQLQRRKDDYQSWE